MHPPLGTGGGARIELAGSPHLEGPTSHEKPGKVQFSGASPFPSASLHDKLTAAAPFYREAAWKSRLKNTIQVIDLWAKTQRLTKVASVVNATAHFGNSTDTATAVISAALLHAGVSLGLSLRLTDRGLRLIHP